MHLTLGLASVLLFLTTLMFLTGLEVTFRQEVLAATRHYGLLARSLLANLVFVPILAIIFTNLAHLPREIVIGILLMAAAPGVPFLSRMAGTAKGNVAFAVALMFVLQVASVVTTPVTLNLILPVEEATKVPFVRAIATLIMFQLLPLVLGMIVKHKAESLAGVLQRPVRVLSTLGLVGTILLFVLPRLDVLGTVAGGGALLIMLILVVVAWPIGWALGGADASIRKVLAIGTSLRNVGLCLLIATQNFPGTAVAASVTAYLIIQAIANLVFAKSLGRATKPEVAAALAKPL